MRDCSIPAGSSTPPIRAQPALRDPRVRKQYAVIDGAHRSTAVFRSHPEYAAPEGLLERLREMIAAAP